MGEETIATKQQETTTTNITTMGIHTKFNFPMTATTTTTTATTKMNNTNTTPADYTVVSTYSETSSSSCHWDKENNHDDKLKQNTITTNALNESLLLQTKNQKSLDKALIKQPSPELQTNDKPTDIVAIAASSSSTSNKRKQPEEQTNTDAIVGNSPKDVQLFALDFDTTNKKFTQQYGRSKRRIQQVVRYDSTPKPYKEEKKHQEYGKIGSGFLCPNCSNHLSYDATQCSICHSNYSYVAGTGVVLSRDRSDVILTSTATPLIVEHVIIDTPKQQQPQPTAPRNHKLKQKRKTNCIETNEETTTTKHINNNNNNNKRTKPKKKIIKPPPTTITEEDEIDVGWTELSFQKLKQLLPMDRSILPSRLLNYESIVTKLNARLNQRPTYSKQTSARNNLEYVKEVKLYNRGIRERSGKAESERLEKFKYKEVCEDLWCKLQYENRCRKKSAAEIECEEFLHRPIEYVNSNRNRRDWKQCTSACDLCSLVYAKHTLTHNELGLISEGTTSAKACVLANNKTSNNDIPNPLYQKLQSDNDIPDDTDNETDTSKEEYYWNLMHLKGTLKFIHEYNKGLLCNTTDNSTKVG